MKELRAREIREMSSEEREKRLRELQRELMHERGVSAMGGAPPNPGRIRSLRRQIARIMTVIREEERK